MSPRTAIPLPILFWLAVGGLALATLLARLGRLSWCFELFSHFPAQYAAALLLTIALALLFRQWRPALAGVVVLIPNLLALSHYLPARADTPGPSPDLRVLAFNVLTSNPAREQVRDYLAASEADLILLLEIDPAWLDELAPLRERFPFTAEAPRSDNFGMALFSRHPIKEYEFRTTPGQAVAHLIAVVDVQGVEAQFLGVHPEPPVGASHAASRNAYLAAIAPLVARFPRPTVVAGDFNATVWSPAMHDFLGSTGLHDSAARRGLKPTWRREFPPFAIPIDHILHSHHFTCTRHEVGPALGSDHRPVAADFVLRPH